MQEFVFWTGTMLVELVGGTLIVAGRESPNSLKHYRLECLLNTFCSPSLRIFDQNIIIWHSHKICLHLEEFDVRCHS